MLVRILLFFAILPVVEIYVLVKAGQRFGAMNVFFVLLLTALLGLALSRSQGRQLLAQMQLKLSRGEAPAREMIEGVVVFLGGILLLIPGFVSDIIGLTMVLPGLRSLWSLYFFQRMAKAVASGATRAWSSPGGGFAFYSRTQGPADMGFGSSVGRAERDVSPKQIIDVKPEPSQKDE